MAALLEQVLGMRFLEIARADFWGGNVPGDSEHRPARAVAVEPAVNKMQVAWAAASGAHGKGICQARFGTCRKCGNLFMADMQPLDLFLLANSVGQAVFICPAAIALCRSICRYSLMEGQCQRRFFSFIGDLGQCTQCAALSVEHVRRPGAHLNSEQLRSATKMFWISCRSLSMRSTGESSERHARTF
jgi:hypothetical protein